MRRACCSGEKTTRLTWNERAAAGVTFAPCSRSWRSAALLSSSRFAHIPPVMGGCYVVG